MAIGAVPNMWNGFDAQIELFLNHFAGRYAHFDAVMGWLAGEPVVKGSPILFLMWFCLFDPERPGQLRKGFEFLLGALFFSVFACIGARGLAIILPFRTRPMATPFLDFHQPAGYEMYHVNWSSFPSDHAALYFALATGILMISRRAGWLAMAWAAFGICLPRLYVGEHWPTDILAGSVIGIGSTLLVTIPAVRQSVRRLTLRWYEGHPPVFFALLFLWSCETINLFGDVRHVLQVLAHLL